MAERLTNTLEETPTLGFGLKFCSDRNCNSDEDCCNCYAFNQTINKLRQSEDIMEKYDIESFELLEHIIKKGKVINSVIEDFAKEEYDKMKQDRNTWQKACELACEREDDCYVYDNIHRAYEFYQQAKKEGNINK